MEVAVDTGKINLVHLLIFGRETISLFVQNIISLL